MLRIDDLEIGQRFRLLAFGDAPLDFRRRLLALGILPGAELQLLGAAPLGCPLHMELRGLHFALRKDEARPLLWEKL